MKSSPLAIVKKSWQPRREVSRARFTAAASARRDACGGWICCCAARRSRTAAVWREHGQHRPDRSGPRATSRAVVFFGLLGGDQASTCSRPRPRRARSSRYWCACSLAVRGESVSRARGRFLALLDQATRAGEMAGDAVRPPEPGVLLCAMRTRNRCGTARRGESPSASSLATSKHPYRPRKLLNPAGQLDARGLGRGITGAFGRGDLDQLVVDPQKVRQRPQRPRKLGQAGRNGGFGQIVSGASVDACPSWRNTRRRRNSAPSGSRGCP